MEIKTGNKIKVIAIAYGVIVSLGTMIAGIVCWSGSSYLVGLGCGLFFGGPLLAIFSSAILYGIGLIVDNTYIIAQNNNKPAKKNTKTEEKIIKEMPIIEPKRIPSEGKVIPELDGGYYICPVCKAEQDVSRTKCKNCGAEFDV